MKPTPADPKKIDRESWREYVIRQAAPHGLQQECLDAFDRYIRSGERESRAAWCALYDWDI